MRFAYSDADHIPEHATRAERITALVARFMALDHHAQELALDALDEIEQARPPTSKPH